jgi:hypothetical protein
MWPIGILPILEVVHFIVVLDDSTLRSDLKSTYMGVSGTYVNVSIVEAA